MRRMLALVAATSATLTLTPAATTSAGPQDPCAGASVGNPATACGQTTISGDGPGYVRLRVPADTAISLIEVGFVESRPQDITFTGQAPVFGALLRDRTPAPDTRELAALKLGRDYSGYWWPHITWHRNLQADPAGDDRVVVIPAGVYDLYLITPPGTPASITLRFRNLDGAVTLGPETSVGLDYRPLRSRLPSEVQNHVASFGTTLEFDGEDEQFAFYSSAREGDALTATQAWGTCFYEGAPEPEDTAYLPGCPGRVTNDTDAFELIFGPEVCPIGCFYRISYLFRGNYYEHDQVPAGRYGTGTWWATAPRAVRVSAVSFVLDLA